MEFKELELKGVYEITFEPRSDERGFFMRTYDAKEFEELGLKRDWVQENHSLSLKKGIIRGLHFQLPPFAETKFVRCIRGIVFDVFVDLREGSETFGRWGGVELSDTNHKSLFIPRGFAHGFCTLTDACEVKYKVDNYYSRPHERGLLWNDPDINITWPVNNPILSQKDRESLNLKEFISEYHSITI